MGHRGLKKPLKNEGRKTTLDHPKKLPRALLQRQCRAKTTKAELKQNYFLFNLIYISLALKLKKYINILLPILMKHSSSILIIPLYVTL